MHTEPVAVESASAGTACQTSDSRFAYILTAGVLGGIALIAMAVMLLIFAAAASWDTAGSRYAWDDGYAYGRDRAYGDDDGWGMGGEWLNDTESESGQWAL